jgi:hypothetical protein
LSKGGEKVEKSELNPLALGKAVAILESLAYLVLWIVARNLGYAENLYLMYTGLIFSSSTSTIWIIPELLQVAIMGFIGGYLIANLYNRFA